MTPTRTPLDALRSIHHQLWDDERGMDRYAPGVAPGVDLTSLGLHSVRETALGAYLDLDTDDATGVAHARALVAIRNVLDLQYPDSDRPWSGTFPTSAEQPDPPGDDAVEWLHYDPNWRQFIGCILALIDLEHGARLPDRLRHDIGDACRRAVRGEPEHRIADDYTNPNLMHAWLQAHVGAGHDEALHTAGHGRAKRCFERFERFGDVDEYNSPTYDGIDLFALTLWTRHPPTGDFRRWGVTMITALGERVSALYHPTLGAICGPYIRAYGIDLTRYVSLAGIWLHLLGEPAGTVLPPLLDPGTDHIHDLYFLAVLGGLTGEVAAHLRPRAVERVRTHEQCFDGSTASSVLQPSSMVGWERGRRHEASLDQYVPFIAHVAVTGSTAAVGVMVPSETAWIDCTQVADDGFELRAAGRAGTVGLRLVGTGCGAPAGSDRQLRAGPLTVRFPDAPSAFTTVPTEAGWDTHLTWATDHITIRLTVDQQGSAANRSLD